MTDNSKHNIAFIYYDHDTNSGGIGAVTQLLVREFNNKLKVACYLLYNEISLTPSRVFQDKYNISTSDQETLTKFLLRNNIGIIIEQGVVFFNKQILRKAATEAGCRIISIVHAKPDFIKVYPSLYSLFWDFKITKRFSTQLLIMLKLLFFPFYKTISKSRYLKYRRELYEISDQVVVLSKHYIANYLKLLKLKENLKITFIHNPLPYNIVCTREDLLTRRKEVLVVSRLIEPVKGLVSVLKVWRRIESDPGLSDWKLIIVGRGHDETRYKKLAEKYSLKNISFEGEQPPLQYYKRARIFLLTSFFEGFPMTLLEAAQLGLPVIAFNSFESISDLIINNYTGFVVENRDIRDFTSKLSLLMTDDSLRMQLGENSIKHSQSFAIEKIVNNWAELFSKVK